MSDPAYPAASQRRVLSPTELNREARGLLEDAFALVWIEGELSNFSRPTSGHLYFSLKDAAAQVRCAMFRPRALLLRFRPADGMRVLARARARLYEPRGEFQLIVEHLEEAGEGALRREFERLKHLLAAEGLFAAERKRGLPRWPRRLGVITSPSGAAVRDVLSVLRRRFPLLEVEILAVPVQGRDAPPALRAALAAAIAHARHDVLLLTRGGGSLEDLWAFNDELLVRAIAASPIPVVSAIGHEVDFTLADFVADLRAPTPSAAAELLVPDVREVQRTLARHSERLDALFRRLRQTANQSLDRLLARLQAQAPQTRLELGRARLDALRLRLERVRERRGGERLRRIETLVARLTQLHPARRLEREQSALTRVRERLGDGVARRVVARRARLAELGRGLNAVNPLATLHRGYAILFDGQGRVVRSAVDARREPMLRARLADGELVLRPVDD